MRTEYYIESGFKQGYDPKFRTWTENNESVATLDDAKEVLEEAIDNARANNFCKEFIESIGIAKVEVDEDEESWYEEEK